MKNTKFENDVKMYGTQAEQNTAYEVCEFENDVKMYGTQAIFLSVQPVM